ncbi:Rne/Rng family ribonuclease [Actinomycetaceae bacterium TAE3-ERU4]|nr:Rne/Rng family ribonuclease [Actinomycetaceae bacterium TAE3-ERU4]
MNNNDLFSGAETGGNTGNTFVPPSIPAPVFQAPIFQAPDFSKFESTSYDDDNENLENSRGRKGRKRVKSRARSEENSEESVEETSRKNDSSRSRKRKKADSDSPEIKEDVEQEEAESEEGSSRRRRRRRNRSDSEGVDSRLRDPKDEVTALEGSTRLEAKRQRRKEGRREGRKKTIVTEAEFLARRESVDRLMVVRERDGLNQIAVIEDGLLVEHYVARHAQTSKVGNVYVGKIQNVLPSMEAAFVDIGEGRNGVLYAGEVNWDVADASGKQRRIEKALSSGDSVLVQVTKDPIGHKGARLTSQITLAGRYLVLVPSGSMTGISRKLPEKERNRLKKILRQIVPKGYGVIVRTAAEGASEEQLTADVERLKRQWAEIEKKQSQKKSSPYLVRSEPELAVRVVRDIFNEDFRKLIVSGETAWTTISQYVEKLSPELADRLEHYEGETDVFASYRVDQQLAKGMDRKAWLPSGGSLVIDRTEAMTVIDVNTGRYTGSGGTLEETVTKNNLEAAEEIVRQLRLRDIGGIIVIDFVDMVLESNRDLVLRRLVECLGRDRTRHQVSEVTALGLVQMTRKRVGQGLVEAFSTECECCNGRGFIVHDEPIERERDDILDAFDSSAKKKNTRNGRNANRQNQSETSEKTARVQQVAAQKAEEEHSRVAAAMSAIAAATQKETKEESSGEGADNNAQAPSLKSEEKPRRGRGRRVAKLETPITAGKASSTNFIVEMKESASGEASSSNPSVENDEGNASSTEPVAKVIVGSSRRKPRRRAATTGVVTTAPTQLSSESESSASENQGESEVLQTTVASQSAPTVRRVESKRRRRVATTGVVTPTEGS